MTPYPADGVVNEHLRQREDTSLEIEQHIPHIPAVRGLQPVVEHHLSTGKGLMVG